MRFTLLSLIFPLIVTSSCKKDKKEQFYVDALEYNNSLIADDTKLRLNFFERYAQTDPRPETQRINADAHFIHSATKEISVKSKNISDLDLSRKVNELKLQLIRNYAPKTDTMDFKEKFKVQKLVSQDVPVMVLINELLLLENELIYYLSGQIRMYDYKVDIKQAIFKINENQYFALMMVWPGETEIDSIEITTVMHNDIILDRTNYTMKYVTGFLGVVLNFPDTTENKLGYVHIGYTVYDEATSEYMYPTNNYFKIEE